MSPRAEFHFLFDRTKANPILIAPIIRELPKSAELRSVIRSAENKSVRSVYFQCQHVLKQSLLVTGASEIVMKFYLCIYLLGDLNLPG